MVITWLNTWPTDASTNTSHCQLPDTAHSSRTGRVANSYPEGTFTLYSTPALPDVLSVHQAPIDRKSVTLST